MKTARLGLAVVLAFANAQAWCAQTLEVNVFPGGFNWPLWVCADKGFCAEAGLELHVTPTAGSVPQMQGLASGKYHIAFSTVDNIVAYDEGQGEAPLPEPPDFFVFMGGQFGATRLVAQPDIGSVAELRGKSLAVDAATTGYAFVLRKILQKSGLGENDYTLERVGSTSQRAEALMQGKTAATILTTPLEIGPESKGYKRIANAIDVIGPYQAVSGATRRSWASANRDTMVAFIRVYVRSLDWLGVPANRTDAIAIYRKYLPQASEESAGKAWDALLAGREGFQKKAKIDMAGVETVLKLRSEFGRPQKTLTDVNKYVDESYYLEATR